MEIEIFREITGWKTVLQSITSCFEDYAKTENARLPAGYELKVGDELPAGNILYEISKKLRSDIIPALEDLIKTETERRAKENANKTRKNKK